MLVKKVIFLLILLLIISCNILPKNKSLKVATFPLELGVVGEQKKTIQKSNYHVFGIPRYKDKIKISVSLQSFNNTNYKKYFL